MSRCLFRIQGSRFSDIIDHGREQVRDAASQMLATGDSRSDNSASALRGRQGYLSESLNPEVLRMENQTTDLCVLHQLRGKQETQMLQDRSR
jgi:hypothetical protein